MKGAESVFDGIEEPLIKVFDKELFGKAQKLLKQVEFEKQSLSFLQLDPKLFNQKNHFQIPK